VEKLKNIQKKWKILAAEKGPSTHHDSPRISPQSHHKKTTLRTHVFQNHPQKPQQKQQSPGLHQGSIFFWK
jgi:hypothetical protein